MAIPLYDRAQEASRYIGARAEGRRPRVAAVLGSGLGRVADAIENPIEIPYKDIPHFVRSTVEGHAGSLIIGSLGGVEIVAMKGRFHLYEGYSMDEVTLPIRVFSLLGVGCLILTNAAGGISKQLKPGSLMLLADHINLMGDNPLVGANDERFGPRFPDMTEVYSREYRDLAHAAAGEMDLALAEGVYAGVKGPTYETPAEIRMMRDLGADTIGMSTVPEAIVARHAGMGILAVSCITNNAAGLADGEINHDQVIRIGEIAGRKLSDLIVKLAPRLVGLEASSPLG
jgi:purine-nucleoside phosphorylase